MKKLVNGVLMDMTPAEEAERAAADAAWAALPVETYDTLDTAELNRMLVAEGSLSRATLEILFGIIKGTIPVTPGITPLQFANLVRLHMRTRP